MGRQKSLFYKTIICSHCGGHYKRKKERQTYRYICSNYENNRKCQRIPMEELKFVELINRRHGRELSEDEIREIVDHIVVIDKLLFEIHFTNQKPIIYGGTFLQL